MSRERQNGKSDNSSDNGIKHILRSGIKIVATEKQEAHENEETHNCKRDVINIQTPPKSTKAPLVKGTHRLRSEKVSTTRNHSENTLTMHGSPSEKHVSLRRSPRRKITQSSDFSREKHYNQETKIISKRTSSQETKTNVCTDIKQDVSPVIQLRRHSSSEKSSRDLRRSSSPVKTYSNSAKHASPSPDKRHSPRSSKRNSYPPIPLRISPRRKSPVKYCYGSIRSPKRKSKLNIFRQASVSPGRLIAGKRLIKNIDKGNKSPLLHRTQSLIRSPRSSDVKPRGSVAPIKYYLPSVKLENNSPKIKSKWDNGKHSKIFPSASLQKELKGNPKSKKHDTRKSSCGGPSSEIASVSPQKLGKSATERELKKITDYWSPKQTKPNTARILRNGRSLDASVSPGTKSIRIKQEPVNKLEQYGQQKIVNPECSQGTSSVRREIQFGDISSSTVKRKYESTTEDEDDDEDSQSIPRRKKLRSEVKNDELWEGLQIQRFKRLTPKKEKIETQTYPNANVPQCATSVQCQEAVTDFDFSKVIVKKERYDYEDEEDCYGLDEVDETVENQDGHCANKNIDNVDQDRKHILEIDGAAVNMSSILTDQCHNVILESENTKEEATIDDMSSLPTLSQQELEQNRQLVEGMKKTVDSDTEDMYGFDGNDFQFQTDIPNELQQSNTSSYSVMLDLECDTSVSQTIDSERDLEDTFMYYDMPSPSELEQSQPAIEFHEYNDSQDSFEREQATEIVERQKQSLDFQTTPNPEYENQEKLEVRDLATADAESDSELETDAELNTGVQNNVELGSLSSVETHSAIKSDVVGEEITGSDSLNDKLLTDARAENEGKTGKASVDVKLDALSDSPETNDGELMACEGESDAAKIIQTSEMDGNYKYGQDALAEESNVDSEKTGDKHKRKVLEDTSAVKVGVQGEGTLVDCDVNKDGFSTVTTMTTPTKGRRLVIEGTTPKRSVRLQERRESTPSKWDEEYVFTPLRRVDESQKRASTSTQSDVKITDPNQTDDVLNEQSGEKLSASSSGDIVSAANKTDGTCLDSSSNVQNTSIETPSHTTGQSVVPENSDQTPIGKSHLISSGDHPPLKIRVKKSADGTTRIVASPSSKSAILNMCPDNPELVLTPCDKKQKKKDVPMRSLLKPNLMLKKSSSPFSTSKRKKSRPLPEVVPVESENKLSDQKNRKKKEGRQMGNGTDSSRRQQSNASTSGERVPAERAGKRKLDDTDDLLKNVMVGKHASILWLSDNRRHFLLKHSESTPSEIDAMLSDAWKYLGEKERLKYYQRASGAMRDENKHSNAKWRLRQTGKKDNVWLKEDGKMSKKMSKFVSLSPLEQHEELRRWLRFFVYEVSPAEYAKLMADFKETMKDLKENQQKMLKASELEMQALYRNILFQKILDIQDKIVDIYHQKREKQDEIVKEGFDILTKRLIIGDDISFSNTIRSDDLQQVLVDLKLLENERKVTVSGTPLKSKSYENVLEQLQECEQMAEVTAPSIGSCSSGKPSPTPELPEADSRFAKELLFGVKHQMLPHFEVFNLERDLENDRCGFAKEETEEKSAKEIFEKLSKFFDQEALLNNDINFWAPGLSTGRHVSAPSSVLTDCLLADQFKMLARNPSVFGSGVKMLIDPSQLKPFMQGRNMHDFRPAPRIVQYPPTLLRYAPPTGDKSQNSHTKRRVLTSKYDKYKTNSLTGHSPVTVHYAGRPRYPISQSLPKMQQLSQIPTQQPSPQTRWRPSSPLSSVTSTQRPRIVVKEPDNRYTSIIHRRIQNVEGGAVVRYTTTSMGRRPSS